MIFCKRKYYIYIYGEDRDIKVYIYIVNIVVLFFIVFDLEVFFYIILEKYFLRDKGFKWEDILKVFYNFVYVNDY